MKKLLWRLTDRNWIPATNCVRWILCLISFLLIIFLVLWLLGIAIGQDFLAKMPLEIWEQATPAQQEKLAEAIAQEYMKFKDCQIAEITVVSDGTLIWFFAECVRGDDV